ncbi:MAG: hypothetical protein NT129_05735 [Candidatus Aenigmarchaeota archaeon]|nr:hypothetical protein [Candidatus Aenigmarchaeota archaeon]
MPVAFQLLDADYFLNANKPVVRLFGKTASGNSVCALFDQFQPYFYIKPNEKALEKLSELKEIIKIEEVEKFTPVGYHEKPVKLLKLTITNPRDTPEIKEKLLQEKIAEECYEADILFKYRFLIDHKLHGMTWVEVDGEKTFTSTTKTTAYHAKSAKPLELTENAPLRILSFDIECLPTDVRKPLDSKKDPIIMISIAFEPSFRNKKTTVLVAKHTNDENTQGFTNEKAMLEEFLRTIDLFDPDIITGYNCNNFDLPYLLERLNSHKLPANLGRCKDKQAYMKIFGLVQDCAITGRVVVDPYQILKRDPWVKFLRYDLNSISKKLLNSEKMSVEYGDMPKLWNSDKKQLSILIEYCRKDAVLNMRLLLERRLMDKFFELSKISGLLLQDTFGGQTARIETIILHEFKKMNFVMPSKPSQAELNRRIREREKKELKGATVLEPKKGLHADGCILVLDFKSLYPSIMRTYNVSPDALLLKDEKIEAMKSPIGTSFVDPKIREGILPSVLSRLLDARSNIKKLMRTASGEEKRILNAKQLALKDMSNSFYGYTGYIRARLYMIDVANTVTAYGRDNLLKTKKLVEENFKVEVLYADTDSMFLRTDIKDLDEAKKEGEKIAKFVTDNLPGFLELQFEKIYRSFLILTKKRYAGWKFESVGDEWKNEIEMKGIETIRRDWCQLVTETMENVINIVLKEGDLKKAIDEVRRVLEQLRKNEIPLEKLTVTKGITKSIEAYEGTLPHIELARKLTTRNPHDPPKIGDRLDFVIIKGNQMLSKRAEDPTYAKKHSLQIDSEYYMESQLFPPIERILNAVGITKSELLGSGRQVSIHDIMNPSNKRAKPNIDFTVSKKQEKQTAENQTLDGWESIICKKCSRQYRRMPLQGACECGGELLIANHGSIGSKIVNKT